MRGVFISMEYRSVFKCTYVPRNLRTNYRSIMEQMYSPTATNKQLLNFPLRTARRVGEWSRTILLQLFVLCFLSLLFLLFLLISLLLIILLFSLLLLAVFVTRRR